MGAVTASWRWKMRNELIASFDDDSYPLDADYFERARTLMQTLPNTALIGASLFHRHETVMAEQMVVSRTASFGAGGVVLRIGLAGADPPAERTT